MATQDSLQIQDKFEIAFPDGKWQAMAKVILHDRPALASIIEKTFEVSFDPVVKNNKAISAVTRIGVTGGPGSQEKLRKAFNELKRLYDDQVHFDKPLMTDLTKQVAFDGKYTRNNFAKSANQNVRGGFVARNEKQAKYYRDIQQNDITFGVGPAGTGKTHVAVAAAVEALKSGKVSKIILTRPAKEAGGEAIGFLPGDLEEKVSPYLRALYDELERHYGPNYKTMIGKSIEIAPVGFMRGRTLTKSFIIVDEAQNLTHELMKMVLTRLGEGSKMVVDGDPDQSDLEPGQSGLQPVVERLLGLRNIAVTVFNEDDIVRHETVKAVVSRLGKDFGKAAAKPAKPAPATKRAPAAKAPKRQG